MLRTNSSEGRGAKVGNGQFGKRTRPTMATTSVAAMATLQLVLGCMTTEDSTLDDQTTHTSSSDQVTSQISTSPSGESSNGGVSDEHTASSPSIPTTLSS